MMISCVKQNGMLSASADRYIPTEGTCTWLQRCPCGFGGFEILQTSKMNTRT